uniref:Uncharacterized protein n=1 Tax=Lepeophtheirus salmonis TaxID=72036 RepID=A0A0K2U5M6_LEPSM
MVESVRSSSRSRKKNLINIFFSSSSSFEE